jgi:hypothetical protein
MKNTKIELCNDSKPLVSGENKYSFDPITNNNSSFDESNIKVICDYLESIPEEEHCNIYVLMRDGGVQPSFFSKSARGVYFDFAKLTPKMQRDIYNYIQLAIQDNSRMRELEKFR